MIKLRQRIRNCGNTTLIAMLKTLLIFFNLIIFVFGISLVSLSIYGLTHFHSLFSVSSSSTAWFIILSTGLFMFTVSVMSFWCIPKGVSWLLYLYGAIVFLLFVALMTISSMFMIRRDYLETRIGTEFKKQMDNYHRNPVAIDLMQIEIQCCGLTNYTNWFETEWANKTRSVPVSCCMDRQNCNNTNLNTINANGIWNEGCYSKMSSIIEDKFTVIGGIGFACATLVFLGSVLSFWLASSLGRGIYERFN